MMNPASYILSAYSFIENLSSSKILDVGYQSKNGNPIPSFDENILIELCSNAQYMFEKENNILEINGDVIIVGDIHGSFHDLLRILKFIQKNNAKVLFLGDYVDRGNFSLECITLLFALKVNEPDRFFLIRGNHEFDPICIKYGFYDEIMNYHDPQKVNYQPSLPNEDDIFDSDSFLFLPEEDDKNIKFLTKNQSNDQAKVDTIDDRYKYTEELYKAFIKAFSYLPLSAIVNETNFCVHGGLSPHLEKLDHLQKDIIRPINDFEESKIISDIVWSDPIQSSMQLFTKNTRGRGYFFNQKSMFDFLNKNSLFRMIRSHENVIHGAKCYFFDRCVTVFSASSYASPIENNSAVLKLFQKGNRIECVTFPPLPRLEKSDTAYYKVQPLHELNEKKIHCFSLIQPNIASKITVRMSKMITQRKPNRNNPLWQLAKINSGKTDPYIQRPFVHHSISLDHLSAQSTEEGHSKSEIRKLSSLGDLPNMEEEFANIT